MKISKHKVIPIDLYKRGVLIYWGNINSFKQFTQKHYPNYYQQINECDELSDKSFDAVTIDVGQDCIILLKEFSPEILVHEIVHAALIILEKVGIKVSDNGEELAYLVEYITSQAFDWAKVTFGVLDNAR